MIFLAQIGLAAVGPFLSFALQLLNLWLSPKLLNMFDKKDVELLMKLRRSLAGFQAVLSDAQYKQSCNPDISYWLNELHNAVDSAENLMDQINYEVLRIKVEENRQVSDLNLCLSNIYFLSIKERLENTIKVLGDLQKQIGDLGLIKRFDSYRQEARSPSTSVVDESEIFGRQDETKDLVDRLLSADAKGKNLSVIPIVGMAGIGKTTLAKAVYNNEKVKSHFDLKAWFCVSEPYDVVSITKGLLQEIGSFNLKDDNNLNRLQTELKESLKGKKFLIVLDDVWCDDYNEWDNLRNLFVQGDTGSKIIVTTRKESLALMIGSGKIHMGILPSEVSWDLFKRHSLENRNLEEHPKLEEVGRQIADKCKGLPLALKALAGVLRSKSGVEEWRAILTSDIWEHPSGILPALMLSYNNLPAHLKQCFAYCAIFPKDYPFCKELVIHLWIANGLVQSMPLGNQHFLELVSRSLFGRVPKSTQETVEKFLMHDLVNDLAQIASSKLCLRLEDNEGSRMLERCQHLSYSMGYGEFEKLKPLDKLDQLRTLLPVSIQPDGLFPLSKRVMHNIFPRLENLKALSFSHYAIEEFPDVLFIKLKLLRFLDLSGTDIKRLPDSVCKLYSLETLLLISCKKLEELPVQMQNLISLRHLDMSGSSRLKMPLHLSKLKSIHVLLGANFFLGGCNGSRIEDLGKMHNLYGFVSILELQNMVDRREALKAKLRNKENIEELLLEWSDGTAESSENEKDILDVLQPNRKIKELKIKGYRGTRFPNWLADEMFVMLVKLSLSDCKDCYSLPALGQLPSLKFLAIQEMHRIMEVTEEFYGDWSSKKPFNSLEKLEFVMMPEWSEWHVLGIGEFPALQHLYIKDCPKLKGKLPKNLCSLTGLTISKCPQLILEAHIQLSSLQELEVEDCHSLTNLPCLPNTLNEMRMCRCEKLKVELSVSEMISRGCNMFLESLELDSCDSKSKQLVPGGRTLRVADCHNLTRLLIPAGAEDLKIEKCENLEILSVLPGTPNMPLHSLCITGCKKLKSLPEQMQELLPSLNELILRNCPEIESFPEGGLPFNLEVLSIENCKKLVNSRKDWHLQRLSCLRELSINHDGSDDEIISDENWELPCTIQRLTISNLRTFSSDVVKSLTSLESLDTSNLPQVFSLLEAGLPPSLSSVTLDCHDLLHSLPAKGLRCLTSLQHLAIHYCHQLQSLPEVGLPSSLSRLEIWWCSNLHSLGELALPSSLSKLHIDHCYNLKTLRESELPSSLSVLKIENCYNLQTLGQSALPYSLSELHIISCHNLKTLGESPLPPSLSRLRISNCPNLQSLPVREMPSSISELSISECPLLKPLLEFEKGDYWSKVDHIPTLKIDWEYQ